MRDTLLGEFPGGTKLYAASVARGRAQLGKVDEFVENQSAFDRQARCGLTAASVAVGPAIYLDYVRSQVLAWSAAEMQALKTIVAGVGERFARLALAFPDTLFLVKTSGQEEGYAAYTRGADTIVLPANMVNSLAAAANFGDPLHPGGSTDYLADVLIHECFHLYSKHNPVQRRALYRQLHYVELDTPVALPDTPWPTPRSQGRLPDFKLTNPDTPRLDVMIEMPVNANPDDPASPLRRRALMPVLLATRPYAGGIFFDYLDWRFLAIEKTRRGWQAVLVDGAPLWYASAPLRAQYQQLTGLNFGEEIFHPDEICAQSFVLVVKQPDMGRLLAMQKSLGPA